MADQPLIFAKPRLGMLAPHGPAAEAAFRACDGIVTLKISGGRSNQKRRALYWITCGIVAEILNDMHDLGLTEVELHDETRDRLRMYDEITLPSGRILKRYWSTSDRAMSEADRTVFTERAFKLWSNWTGVPVDALTSEARAA